MAFNLVVTQPFDEYEKGAVITDPVTVAQVLKEHAAHVVKVAAPGN
ncbi:hypothetical protein [Xanthobacter versatilis]